MPPTRRTFLRAAGVAALAAVPALAACGAPADTAAPRLRVAFPGRGPLGVPDVHVLPGVLDRARAAAVAETLTVWTGDMDTAPGLAEVVEPDRTGTRWRIRLAPASCHDGRPVTSADVLASLGRVLAGGSAAPVLAGIDPARTRALSPSELEIGLAAPDFLFPMALGVPGTGIVRDGRGDSPIGTGPFRVVPGSPEVLVRHDGYRGGPPPSAELEFVPEDVEEQRYQDLVDGRIAWAHDLFPHSARRIESRTAVTLMSAPGSVNRLLDMRSDRPPFDDPRVREAVRLVLDRDELLLQVLLDLGVTGDDLYGPGLSGYPAGTPVVRDPERARGLVEAAGAVGAEFDIWFEDPLSRPAMPYVVEQLAAIGLLARPREPVLLDDAGRVVDAGSGDGTANGDSPAETADGTGTTGGTAATPGATAGSGAPGPAGTRAPSDGTGSGGTGSGGTGSGGTGSGDTLQRRRPVPGLTAPGTGTPGMAFRRVDAIPVALFLDTTAAGTPALAPSPAVAALMNRARGIADPAARDDALRRAQVVLRSASTVWGVGAELTGISADLTGVVAARPDSDRWARFDRARLG